MATHSSNPIIDAYQAGNSVEAPVDALDLCDSASSEILERAWNHIRASRNSDQSSRADQALECIRAALQTADEQQGLNTGGLARCPFCIHMCLWGEAEHCEHYVGVIASELEVQDLLQSLDQELAERWGDSWGSAEGNDLPPGVLPDAVSEELGSSEKDSLLALLKHCGAVAVDATAGDGGHMEVVFAKSTKNLESEVRKWIKQFEGWAETLAEDESD